MAKSEDLKFFSFYRNLVQTISVENFLLSRIIFSAGRLLKILRTFAFAPSSFNFKLYKNFKTKDFYIILGVFFFLNLIFFSPKVYNILCGTIQYVLIFANLSIERIISAKSSEPVTQRCSTRKVLLKTSQNSQENTCFRVLFLV